MGHIMKAPYAANSAAWGRGRLACKTDKNFWVMISTEWEKGP